MFHAERYRGPLRAAYERLARELPRKNKSGLLQMALHRVNNTVGAEGLCHTLCVFGAVLRLARSVPVSDQIDRARATDTAMEDVAKEPTKPKIAFGLKYREPCGKKQTQLDHLSFGAPACIYRETTKT